MQEEDLLIDKLQELCPLHHDGMKSLELRLMLRPSQHDLCGRDRFKKWQPHCVVALVEEEGINIQPSLSGLRRKCGADHGLEFKRQLGVAFLELLDQGEAGLS